MEENKNLIPEEQGSQTQESETQESKTQGSETPIEPITEPVIEPVVEPAVEPAAESVVEPAVEPAAESVVEPAPKAENEPVRAYSAPQQGYVPPMQPVGGVYTVPVMPQPMVQQPMMQQPMRPSYCYQNPYQNFGLYTAPTPTYTYPSAPTPPPAAVQPAAPAPQAEATEEDSPASEDKKGRYTPLIVTSAVAGGILLICCVIIAFGIVRDLFTGGNSEELIAGEDDRPSSETVEESAGTPERDENVVYNMPDIQTGEKTGKELSLVEINQKVKNSVTGILIAADEKAEFEFSGSGVIISEDGYILTNNHVIEGSAKLKAVLSDGITEYEAAVVGRDERSDLAVLKVNASGLQAAELGNSDQLEVGETVVAIGNPYGMELAGTVTNGIVSALNRKIEMNGSFMTLIQTNASINPGNSGGPLVNAYGQVIGITSSKLVATGYEGIGFAIPINHVVEVSGELISYGYIKTRAYIGIQGSSLEEGYADYYGLPQGVYVYYVDPDCDAAKKGLKKDDVIIGFAGKEIKSMAELNDLKDQYKPGDQVALKVWREEKTFEITITLTEST